MSTTTMHRQLGITPRVAAETVATAAAVALLTWGIVRLHVRTEPAAVLYLCLVVLVSLRGNLVPALLAAVGGTVVWDHFFTSSSVGLIQRETRDVVALVALCVTAIVITRLMTALRTSEAHWRNAFENNPTMYFMVDPAGTVLSVNPFGAEQLGYAVDELVGQPVLSVVLEEDKAAAQAQVARCLSQIGQSLSWELRKVRRDGTMLWVRETARAVQRGRERPVVLIACEDVTERKLAQELLRDNEARLRRQASLLDLTHDAIFVRDLSSVIVYWNRGAEEMYGWSREEAMGQVTHDLLQTEFLEPLDRIVATVLRTGRWDGELSHTKRDGTRVVVASRWSVQRDEAGDPTGFLEINNDVSVRKRAEEELRRSEAFLTEAQRLSRTGSFGWNVSTGALYWSAETYRIFGVEPGTPPSIDLVLRRVHPEDRTDVQRTIEQAQREGRDFEHRYRLLMPDDSVRHLHVVARGVRDDTDRLEFVGAVMDITERERAAEALRRSESYLAEAQRLTHTGTFAIDPDTLQHTFTSEEMLRICGLDPAAGIPSQAVLMDLVHPDDRDRLFPSMRQAFRAGERFETEYRLQLHDGTLKHLNLIAHPVFAAAGALVEHVGTVVDVTERKRAEEERQANLWFLESLERVNRAIQGANDVEHLMRDALDVTRSIFDCDRLALLHPCDPDAPSYRISMAGTRPEWPIEHADDLADIPLGDEYRHVFKAARASASPIHLDAHTDPPLPERASESGTRSALVIALQPKVDAPYLLELSQCSRARVWSEREERLLQEVGRRIADALATQLVLRGIRESARRYRNIFQMADVSIWEQDFSQVKAAIDELKAQGIRDFRRYFGEHPEFVARAVQLVQVIDVNDATLRLYGAQSKEELLVSLDKVFTPETLDVFVGELIAVAEGRTSFAAETVERTLGGERLDIAFTIAFPPEPTHLESVLVSIMDITARKRAEEALQRAQSELARASTLTTMGQLAGSIAHELRQPLAAIAMNGSAVLRWLGRESPNLAEAQEAAARVVQDAARGDDVIRGLRALLSKSDPQRQSLDVNDIIYQVLELARGELKRNNVTVQADLAPKLPLVLCDRVQLQQVLLNLIVNAIEAMGSVPERTKVLTIRSARADSGEVAVAVEDTGPGIDPATADRVFHPFFTTKANGLGLGLSICRSIVDAHGGELSAIPRSPHGTTFRFTIQATAASQVSAAETPYPPASIATTAVSPPPA